MFEFTANKYPGACFYCARRVKGGEGAMWKDGAWCVAHGECLSSNIAAGREPRRTDHRTMPAHVIKSARHILKTVRLDASTEELERAVRELREAVGLARVEPDMDAAEHAAYCAEREAQDAAAHGMEVADG